ncbi:MAG TPA: hypothetical protein VK742_03820 [Candidatus Sulfotelmatobacter sp.]|nr:hypothetical protein [Candidatus Sulfotelmatobacter sp.]
MAFAEAGTKVTIQEIRKAVTFQYRQKLSENGVVVTLCADRKGQKYIRLSPHFYNTGAELQRTVESL